MVKRTPARLVVVVCTLALASTTGAGVASAEPDLSPFINTTCTYSQATAALNALSPDGGNEFSASPTTQTWLHAFVDSPVEQRRQLIQQQAPALAQYTAVLAAMANTCKNYPAA
jgi:hemophore-related protein